MEFRLLGPLQVVQGERFLALPTGLQRTLLVLLLLHRNRVVSTERLVEELWNGRAPPTAAKIVRNYVSLLRKELTSGGEVELVAEAGGYVLRVPAGAVDVERFEALGARGRSELESGEPEEASATFAAALALWRGPPLADVAFEGFAQTEAARLEELRLTATAGRIEAELELGKHSELVPELEALVRDHPLNEDLRAQLMLALYRSGRQADALAAYHEGRRALVAELGLEPGPRLRTLERLMLAHDASLQAPSREKPWHRRGSLLDSTIVAVLIAAGVLLAFAIVRGGREAEQASVVLGPNSVGAIGPERGTIVAQVLLGARASRLAGAGDRVWALSSDERTLYRIDAAGQRLTGSARFDGFVSDVAANDDVAVVLHAGPSSAAVVTSFTADDDTPLAIGTVPTGATLSGSGGASFGPLDDRIAAGPRWFYVSHARGAGPNPRGGLIVRGRDDAGRIEARELLPAPQFNLTAGTGAVWTVTDHNLRRLDPLDLRVLAEIRLASPEIALDVAIGEGAVWVVNQPSGRCCPPERFGRGHVTRVDPEANAVVTTIPVGGDPEAIAAGLGSVWVTDARRQAVLRIDPQSNRVVDTIELGARPTGIAIAGGLVWVSVS
jgi:DNA-binding SARP family transcriptional activator/DNA-binding beta-propeller fold protein YncE